MTLDLRTIDLADLFTGAIDLTQPLAKAPTAPPDEIRALVLMQTRRTCRGCDTEYLIPERHPFIRTVNQRKGTTTWRETPCPCDPEDFYRSLPLEVLTLEDTCDCCPKCYNIQRIIEVSRGRDLPSLSICEVPPSAEELLPPIPPPTLGSVPTLDSKSVEAAPSGGGNLPPLSTVTESPEEEEE